MNDKFVRDTLKINPGSKIQVKHVQVMGENQEIDIRIEKESDIEKETEGNQKSQTGIKNKGKKSVPEKQKEVENIEEETESKKNETTSNDVDDVFSLTDISVDSGKQSSSKKEC